MAAYGFNDKWFIMQTNDHKVIAGRHVVASSTLEIEVVDLHDLNRDDGITVKCYRLAEGTAFNAAIHNDVLKAINYKQAEVQPIATGGFNVLPRHIPCAVEGDASERVVNWILAKSAVRDLKFGVAIAFFALAVVLLAIMCAIRPCNDWNYQDAHNMTTDGITKGECIMFNIAGLFAVASGILLIYIAICDLFESRENH